MYVNARTNRERVRFLASDHTFRKNLNLVKKPNVVVKNFQIFFYLAQNVGGGRGAGSQGFLGPTHSAGPAMTKFDHRGFSKHDKTHPGRLITTQNKNTS